MSHNHGHACHDEHTHSHGGDGHDHDHSDDITPALQDSLYRHIEFDKITALNEATYGSGKAICKKTWQERMNPEPELVSDCDEQLIVNIPFTGQVKLHSILLRSSDSPSAPKTLKVIINREDVDFSVAEEASGTQTFELSRTSEIQELPVKRARFNAVRRLALFFPDNFGSSGDRNSDESDSGNDGDEEVTRLSYLGFKGEWSQLGRAPVSILYEAAANPADHKVKGVGANAMGHGVGGRGGDGM
ncbi:PITH domain-containing protein [Diplogelasinospora grovesii]|uniref:PITH domain-containing protein n=1 Tax=Diplogelasinospora grovesii TaxID=303347 RepID=A0AAN6NE46_9PEZI|nr:PITH domain-containing protein [Diplogelasinospora grovesii]